MEIAHEAVLQRARAPILFLIARDGLPRFMYCMYMSTPTKQKQHLKHVPRHVGRLAERVHGVERKRQFVVFYSSGRRTHVFFEVFLLMFSNVLVLSWPVRGDACVCDIDFDHGDAPPMRDRNVGVRGCRPCRTENKSRSEAVIV